MTAMQASIERNSKVISKLQEQNAELEHAINANALSVSAKSSTSGNSAFSNHSQIQTLAKEFIQEPYSQTANNDSTADDAFSVEEFIQEHHLQAANNDTTADDAFSVEEAEPEFQTMFSAEQLQIIESILDRAQVANRPSAPIPPDQLYSYRRLSRIEEKHNIALVYIVGIKTDTTYSLLWHQLKALDVNVQAILNICKISNTTFELMVHAPTVGLVCKKLQDIGFKILVHFHMNRQGTAIDKLVWNAKRLNKIEQSLDTDPRVQSFAHDAIWDIVNANPSIDPFTLEITLT
ncbi:hypothetical protein HDU78_000368 [Chytriomyces hyalinus]|nr:hypothetical protein HDU78_000368 [Chytriomyces hyalinus]